MFHPTTFGKYFLTRRIAVGGMAEVFAAKLYGADGFEKDLVIKQILPQYARDPEFVQSFVAEAKIAVSLTHANIVGIYELGRVDGTYFIAMEFVDGQDVFALLDAARRHKEPLGTGLALLIVEEVCRGLDYAHRKTGPDGLPLGLVHRDLNPRNVLVSREGDVKILDFGIAKTGHKIAAMPKTRAGVVKGTTGYMSPEQATGQNVDHRTDLYQAGLLLYECLTGHALFWRPEDHVTRELMRRHEIPPPSSQAGGIHPEVDALALKSLRIRPDERFQSAVELAAAAARLRAIDYPDASQRTLGAWVTRLLERDRAATRALEDEIPATADFSEVISQAIQQSITGQVETIATRSVGGLVQAQSRPTTGSQPLDPRVITGDLLPIAIPGAVGPGAVLAGAPIAGPIDEPPLESLPDTTEEPDARAFSRPVGDYATADVAPPDTFNGTGIFEGEDFEATEDRPTGPLDGGRRFPWAAVAAVAAAVTMTLLFLAIFPVPNRAEAPGPGREESPSGGTSTLPATYGDPADRSEDSTASSARPTPTRTGGAERPSADRTARPRRDQPREPVRPLPTRSRSASADFGSVPCVSRVTVDGKRLANPTPIFDYRLKPGKHRVVVVGEGCPAENAPGALEPKTPRLSTVVEVEPGIRLKILADFGRGRISVRSVE